MSNDTDCFQFVTCSTCLSQNPNCVWCDDGENMSFCSPRNTATLPSCDSSKQLDSVSGCSQNFSFYIALSMVILGIFLIAGIMVAFFWTRLYYVQHKDHAERAKSISKRNRMAASAAEKAEKRTRRSHKRDMKKAARMINERVKRAEEAPLTDVETPTDERLFNPTISKTPESSPPASPSRSFSSPKSRSTAILTSTVTTTTTSTTSSPITESLLNRRRGMPKSSPSKGGSNDSLDSESDGVDDPFQPPKSVIERLTDSQQMKDFSSRDLDSPLLSE